MTAAAMARKLRIRVHEGQRRLLASDAFCTAAIAGTGGGKTVAGMVWLLVQMTRNPGRTWVVAEPTDDMVERVLLTGTADRMGLIDFLGLFDPDQVWLRSKGVLRHRLGTVFLVSARNPETLQGAHVAGVWLDEAGLMRMGAWLVALQRVGLAEGRILITTTPYNKGWLKTEVYDPAMEGNRDFAVVQFPSTANPRYPAEAIERARRSMPASRFAMLYRGEFGRPEGMVYDCFDSSKHVVEPFEIPRDWRRLGGIDFGYNNPTAGVFLARDPDGVYYWYGEHYERERTLDEHAARLTELGGRELIWYGDRSAPQQMAELRRNRLSVLPADNDVQAGIDTVYSLLASGRLKVFRSCRFGINELEGYVWDRRPGGDGAGFLDRPVKEDDHLMDALRYALHTTEKRPALQLRT